MQYERIFVQQLIKAVKDYKLYQKESENTVEFIDRAYESLLEIQKEEGPFIILVDEDKIMNGSDILYEDPKRITSVPLFLYRNGIRSFTFLEGVRREEIRELTELIARKEYTSNVGLVEDLWRSKFEHIIYHAVEKREKETSDDYVRELKSDRDMSIDSLSIVPVRSGKSSSMATLKKSVSTYKPKIRIARQNSNFLLLISLKDLLKFEKNPRKRTKILSIFKSSVENFLEEGDISMLLKAKRLLEYLLDTEKNQEGRNLLYEIFDIISSEEAIQLYVYAMSEAKSKRIKKKAISLLGFIGVDVVDNLINELEITEDNEIKEAIISLLEGIFNSNRDELIRRIDTASDEIFDVFLTIIKRSGDPYYIDVLESMLAEKKSRELVEVLFSILPREEMIKYIDHNDPSIRIKALRGMKEIWGEREFKLVTQRILSRNFWSLPEDERRQLLQLLATLKVKETVELFRTILKKWHFFNRRVFETKRMAVEALAKMKTEDAQNLLKRYSKARHLRETVKRALENYEE